MFGAHTDITERKQAEQKQSQTYELLTNLARLVPGVIYQYRLYPDGKSAFPYSSPGMYSIYEVTPEQVREDATPVFGRLHPEDADRVSNLIFESPALWRSSIANSGSSCQSRDYAGAGHKPTRKEQRTAARYGMASSQILPSEN